MEWLILIISVPGVTLGLLGWALWVQADRRRFRRAIEEQHCKLCGTCFADALIDDLGRPSHELLGRLDAFQRRFAHRAVVCQECGAVNVCTRDGVPYRAFAA
ncbi:MAG: hypothetical protein J0M02_02200 [Planctomycetes bacterium]|nr:hypothetical protein [Planctomycetota bacterium]